MLEDYRGFGEVRFNLFEFALTQKQTNLEKWQVRTPGDDESKLVNLRFHIS